MITIGFIVLEMLTWATNFNVHLHLPQTYALCTLFLNKIYALPLLLFFLVNTVSHFERKFPSKSANQTIPKTIIENGGTTPSSHYASENVYKIGTDFVLKKMKVK